jgi:hypothetical protein
MNDTKKTPKLTPPVLDMEKFNHSNPKKDTPNPRKQDTPNPMQNDYNPQYLGAMHLLPNVKKSPITN